MKMAISEKVIAVWWQWRGWRRCLLSGCFSSVIVLQIGVWCQRKSNMKS